MLFRKKHLKANFTHPWKTKIKLNISTYTFQNILDGCLNQEYQSSVKRCYITIPILHKRGQHWFIASVYLKLKLILHFDSKYSVYLDVFQGVLYIY